jgi:anti-sigma B factor antagonist
MTWDQPSEPLLRIESTRIGDRVVIILCGELDLSCSDRLYEETRIAIDGGARELVCDLSELTFVDSTGLSVFLSARKRLKSLGGTFRLISPTPDVRRMLDVAGVVPFLMVTDETI